jgi:DNA-binding FadR family transcriptional regulator
MIGDVLLMRRTMAVEVARVAASRATDDSLRELREVLDRQRANEGDLLRTLLTDLELYEAMVSAADSIMASLLFSTLNRLARACLELVPALLYVHPEYVASMGLVVDAIEEGKPDEAGRALSHLLEKTDAVLVERLRTFPETL